MADGTKEMPPNTLPEADRKDYSRKQIVFLKERGITDARKRSRIFKAAGPGQVQQAWDLATCENWETDEGKIRKDLLDCLLSGAGCGKFGRGRMSSVLAAVSFPVPEAYSVKQFFRILDGALEILSPGSYEFTTEELAAIEKGLTKHYDTIKNADELDTLRCNDA